MHLGAVHATHPGSAHRDPPPTQGDLAVLTAMAIYALRSLACFPSV
jgi:hypothetical protein